MFKLSNRTKVNELKDILNANITAVKKSDKTLADQIMYAGKHSDKATKKDLYDLTKQVVELLGEKLVVPALAEEPKTETAEAEKPKTKKKLSKADSEQAVKKPAKKKADNKEEDVEEKPKKSDKKTSKKSEGVVDLEASSKQATQLAKMFPQTISVGDETYEVARDITSMDDLYNALNDEQDIVLAFYWTKRHLKQFDYFFKKLGQPKAFDHDLDLANLIYVSDEKKIAYGVSVYTEAPYSLLANEIPETDEGLRFAEGIEYQIYRKTN